LEGDKGIELTCDVMYFGCARFSHHSPVQPALAVSPNRRAGYCIL